MKKKKKKIFQELFRLFQKGNKRNQKDTDMLHNSNTSFASAVATRSEIPGSLEHPQEPSQQQPMKVESLGVCESADQFGFNVSSLDDIGFQSLDPSKEWNSTSNMALIRTTIQILLQKSLTIQMILEFKIPPLVHVSHLE